MIIPRALGMIPNTILKKTGRTGNQTRSSVYRIVKIGKILDVSFGFLKSFTSIKLLGKPSIIGNLQLELTFTKYLQ